MSSDVASVSIPGSWLPGGDSASTVTGGTAQRASSAGETYGYYGPLPRQTEPRPLTCCLAVTGAGAETVGAGFGRGAAGISSVAPSPLWLIGVRGASSCMACCLRNAIAELRSD